MRQGSRRHSGWFQHTQRMRQAACAAPAAHQRVPAAPAKQVQHGGHRLLPARPGGACMRGVGRRWSTGERAGAALLAPCNPQQLHPCAPDRRAAATTPRSSSSNGSAPAATYSTPAGGLAAGCMNGTATGGTLVAGSLQHRFPSPPHQTTHSQSCWPARTRRRSQGAAAGCRAGRRGGGAVAARCGRRLGQSAAPAGRSPGRPAAEVSGTKAGARGVKRMTPLLEALWAR